MIRTGLGRPRSIALALSVTVAVAACSSGSDADPDQTAATTSSTAPSVPTSDRQLTIGVMLPPAATLLRDPILNGVDTAVEQINANGGVFNRRVRRRLDRGGRHGRSRSNRRAESDRRGRRRDHRPGIVDDRGEHAHGHRLQGYGGVFPDRLGAEPRRSARPRSLLPHRAERLDAGECHRPGRGRHGRAVGRRCLRGRRIRSSAVDGRRRGTGGGIDRGGRLDPVSRAPRPIRAGSTSSTACNA